MTSDVDTAAAAVLWPQPGQRDRDAAVDSPPPPPPPHSHTAGGGRGGARQVQGQRLAGEGVTCAGMRGR